MFKMFEDNSIDYAIQIAIKIAIIVCLSPIMIIMIMYFGDEFFEITLNGGQAFIIWIILVLVS